MDDNQIFAIVEGGKVDFFFLKITYPGPGCEGIKEPRPEPKDLRKPAQLGPLRPTGTRHGKKVLTKRLDWVLPYYIYCHGKQQPHDGLDTETTDVYGARDATALVSQCRHGGSVPPLPTTVVMHRIRIALHY